MKGREQSPQHVRPAHPVFSDGHRLQNFVQQLQRPMQLHLNPARSVLDAWPRVVGAPALDETEPQHTKLS